MARVVPRMAPSTCPIPKWDATPFKQFRARFQANRLRKNGPVIWLLGRLGGAQAHHPTQWERDFLILVLSPPNTASRPF